ncbi:MAG: periplasmic heavy metal sensor [Bacteroidetes bacterium]|nr:periplasmic heavy metal sensor [Bacteroidota bacterium]
MKKLIVMIIVAIFIIGFQVYGQQNDYKEYAGIIKQMKLTGDQEKEAQKIRIEMQKQMIDQNAKIQKARLDLEEALKAEIPDKSVIEDRIKEISELEAQMHIIRVESWFNINSILTLEQQKIWKNVLEEQPAVRGRMMNQGEKMPMKKGVKNPAQKKAKVKIEKKIEAQKPE